MTNDRSDTKFSQSLPGIDHYVVNQGLLAGNEDHLVDVVPFTGHTTTEEALSLKENQINSLPVTALVLGLAAATCFLLLSVYIIVKVHFCKKQTSKDMKSSTSRDTLQNSPSTVIQKPINSFYLKLHTGDALPNQQSESNFYRIHPTTKFCNQSSEPPFTENSSPSVSLAAAKFLPEA